MSENNTFVPAGWPARRIESSQFSSRLSNTDEKHESRDSTFMTPHREESLTQVEEERSFIPQDLTVQLPAAIKNYSAISETIPFHPDGLAAQFLWSIRSLNPEKTKEIRGCTSMTPHNGISRTRVKEEPLESPRGPIVQLPTAVFDVKTSTILPPQNMKHALPILSATPISRDHMTSFTYGNQYATAGDKFADQGSSEYGQYFGVDGPSTAIKLTDVEDEFVEQAVLQQSHYPDVRIHSAITHSTSDDEDNSIIFEVKSKEDDDAIVIMQSEDDIGLHDDKEERMSLKVKSEEDDDTMVIMQSEEDIKLKDEEDDDEEFTWPPPTLKPKHAAEWNDVDDDDEIPRLPRLLKPKPAAGVNDAMCGSGALRLKHRGSDNKASGPVKGRRQELRSPKSFDKILSKVGKTHRARKNKRASKPSVNSGVKGITEDFEFLGYDPIAAHLAEPDVEEAPTIEASTKKVQLAAMRACCPPGGDRRRHNADVNAIEKASRVFGRNKVKAEDGFWLLEGMKTPLYHHQLIGAAWMYGRETSSEGPSGGICADSMGTGKTIETLATMVGNRPTNDIPRKESATLIICPSTLIEQWRDELEAHCEEDTFSPVTVYKASHGDRIAQVASHNVVFTSYWEIAQSCPWFTKKFFDDLRKKGRKKKGRPEDDDPHFIEEAIKEKIQRGEGGILHKIKWYRVVLDEAHCIKNHLTRTSFAVNALQATYRLALSGTHIMNRPEEYWAYLRFFRVTPVPSFTEFKLRYCDYESEICSTRTRALASKIMLRRTPQSQILSRPVVKLPTPYEAVLMVECDAQERIMIDALEERFLQLAGNDYPDGDPRNNFKNLFHQFTRHRQMTDDVLIIPREFKILFEVEKLRAIQKQLRALSSSDSRIYNELTVWIQEKRARENKQESYLQEDMDLPMCRTCHDQITEPQLINLDDCQHIFCSACIEKLNYEAALNSLDLVCPVCGTAFEPEDVKDTGLDERLSKASDETNVMGIKKKGKDLLGYRPKPQPKQYSSLEWMRKHDARHGKPQFGSKLRALQDELTHCRRGDPSDKKIIYVQWLPAAVMIGTMMEQLGIQFVYYWGDMDRHQRSLATSAVKSNPEVKYMISGLKCGGVGLNWTWANHVIIIDPWWNKCVESQAFCRAHRIGQQKPCFLVKLFSKETIDDRLLELQRKKCKMLNATTPAELSSEDMGFLLNRHRSQDEINMDSE